MDSSLFGLNSLIDWESKIRNSQEEWEEKTATTCLLDWAEAYLDYSKERYVEKTFKEKKSAFKVFFKYVKPELDVADLTPGMVQSFLMQQKKERICFQ
ncbi:MAG: hypothetical protein HQK72_09450 [Desulfamplus sp.]|nr:hypothetical protein [Desulfamplus sp.]